MSLSCKQKMALYKCIYILGLGVTKSIEIELYVENDSGSCVIGVVCTQRR